MATTRSSELYLDRKKVFFRFRRPHPQVQPGKLRSHSQPHEPLFELRDVEDPTKRLVTVPIEDVPAHVDDARSD